MSIWGWIRRTLGFEILDRVNALERRRAHNENSIDGAIAAFKQFAKDNSRD